jgi:hypothetical protein
LRTKLEHNAPRPIMDVARYLRNLNDAQRAAVEYGISDVASADPGPLLIIAGAAPEKRIRWPTVSPIRF